jgi:hypothetical protein
MSVFFVFNVGDVQVTISFERVNVINNVPFRPTIKWFSDLLHVLNFMTSSFRSYNRMVIKMSPVYSLVTLQYI